MSAGSAFAASRAARISAWRRRRAAIGTLDLIACRASSWRKWTYAESTSSSCRRSGSTAAPAQSGMTASSKDALTRPGTTETSSTRRRESSSSRDARPSTAIATDGGRSTDDREPMSSVT